MIIDLLKTKYFARLMAVLVVLAGLLIMHGSSPTAVAHCIYNTTGAETHTHNGGGTDLPTHDPNKKPCATTHDTVTCLATAPRQLVSAISISLETPATLPLVLIGITSIYALRIRTLWPPPTPSLTALCISRT